MTEQKELVECPKCKTKYWLSSEYGGKCPLCTHGNDWDFVVLWAVFCITGLAALFIVVWGATR